MTCGISAGVSSSVAPKHGKRAFAVARSQRDDVLHLWIDGARRDERAESVSTVRGHGGSSARAARDRACTSVCSIVVRRGQIGDLRQIQRDARVRGGSARASGYTRAQPAGDDDGAAPSRPASRR